MIPDLVISSAHPKGRDFQPGYRVSAVTLRRIPTTLAKTSLEGVVFSLRTESLHHIAGYSLLSGHGNCIPRGFLHIPHVAKGKRV